MMIILLYHPPLRRAYVFMSVRQLFNSQYAFDTLIIASPKLFLQYNRAEEVAAHPNTIKLIKKKHQAKYTKIKSPTTYFAI